MVSQRNTIFKYLSALIATFSIAFGLSSVHVSASNTPDLAIAPVYSANQRAKNGIFDLSVKPDTNQKLQLKIANLSKKDQKIEIVPTTAYTSNGGAIALDRRKVPSEPSLKVKFTDLVDKKDQTKIVNIPANETKTVSFEIHIPKNHSTEWLLVDCMYKRLTEMRALLKRVLVLKIVLLIQWLWY